MRLRDFYNLSEPWQSVGAEFFGIFAYVLHSARYVYVSGAFVEAFAAANAVVGLPQPVHALVESDEERASFLVVFRIRTIGVEDYIVFVQAQIVMTECAYDIHSVGAWHAVHASHAFYYRMAGDACRAVF